MLWFPAAQEQNDYSKDESKAYEEQTASARTDLHVQRVTAADGIGKLNSNQPAKPEPSSAIVVLLIGNFSFEWNVS